MQMIRAALGLTLLCAAPQGWAAQSTAKGTPDQGAAKDPAQTGSAALLKPALDAAWQTVGSVQLEKWKRGPLRDEADANIVSIRHDIEGTLPDLMKEADANPGKLSKALPVAGNVDALYDVLLRVVNGARVAAPGDQFSALQDALAGLEKARRAFKVNMQEAAVGQEKRISDLEVALKAQPAPVCPVVAAPPPPAPPPTKPAARKRKSAAKPAAKPATPPAATPAAAAPANGAAKPN
jgi:cell division septation protein DedD